MYGGCPRIKRDARHLSSAFENSFFDRGFSVEDFALILRLLFLADCCSSSVISFSLTLKRFFQFSRVLYITHVFPRDAVSSILAAEQQQCEQQNAFYETTKKNEQNHRRKGVCRAMSSNSKSLYLKTVDGNENLPISEIGLGTISWGDESYGFNKQYREKRFERDVQKSEGMQSELLRHRGGVRV